MKPLECTSEHRSTCSEQRLVDQLGYLTCDAEAEDIAAACDAYDPINL